MWRLLFTLAKIAWCLLGLVSFVLHSNNSVIKIRKISIKKEALLFNIFMNFIFTFLDAEILL